MPLQPYSSVSQLCESLRIPQSRLASGWRLTEPLQGEIQGIPSSRGLLLATDGIICIIHRGGMSIFFGHLDFFLPDKETEFDISADSVQTSSRSSSKTQKIFDNFVV